MFLCRDMVQRICPDTSRSQPASAAFAGRTKTSGFAKGRLVHSPLVQYLGSITALDFLARLQLCISGPDISFAG